MKKNSPPLAALLALFLTGCPAREEPARVRRATLDESRLVATVTRRTIEEAVEASGFVESVHPPFEVRPEIGGRIVRVHVENGTRVKHGDLLAELDDTALRADLEEISRNAQLAKLELDRAERDLRRQESLFEEGYSTEKARLDAQTDAQFARLRHQLAAARVEKARVNLAKTAIRAPFDGFVADLGVSVDQIVSANSTALMRVYDFSKLRVVAKFNEFEAARMIPGGAGVITFDSLPGVAAPGTIGYISPFASPEQNLRVFTAKIDFSPKDANVRPGVSANVRLVTRRAENVPSVPVTAVFIDGDERFVYLKPAAGAYARRPVRTGVNDIANVEIREGLNEGDRVSLVRPTGRE